MGVDLNNVAVGGTIDKTHDKNGSKNDNDKAAITVAVRIRPFNKKEVGMMLPSTLEKYGYEVPDDVIDNLAKLRMGEWGNKPVWKAVHAIDERVLVFDPPDEDDGFGGSEIGQTAPLTDKKELGIRGRAFRGMRSNNGIAANNKKHKDIRFVFDQVFNEESTQQQVFEGTAYGMIQTVLEGYNATIFAYGATGCGKTYTISGTKENPGIIFLTMEELFKRVELENETQEVSLSVSYLEVYNEAIRDLLVSEGGSAKGLDLREDVKQGVIVSGLSEHKPKTVEEVMKLVVQGNENRTMSPTAANETSSRSHAVLQIKIMQKPKSGGMKTDITSATLSIIDLAGSERATVSNNVGERMREGANINRSLLALANCINALCDPKKVRHVPYRDSKLTRLLKFSLGGNCKTVMITCVSPSSTYYEETHNTLKYASRAKNIKTTVNKNLTSSKVHIAQYTKKIQEQSEEIRRLQQEVAELKKRGPVSSSSGRGYGGYGGYGGDAATDRRRKAIAEQSVVDIRNRLGEAFRNVSGAQYEKSSAAIFIQAFMEGQQSFKEIKEKYGAVCMEFKMRNYETDEKDKIMDHISESLGMLTEQIRLASRLANHSGGSLQRGMYEARRCMGSTKGMNAEHKYKVEQEYKILQVSSEKRASQRQCELFTKLSEAQARVVRAALGANATSFGVAKHCIAMLDKIVGDGLDVYEVTTFVQQMLKMAVQETSAVLNRYVDSKEYTIAALQRGGGPSKVDSTVAFEYLDDSSSVEYIERRPPLSTVSLNSSSSSNSYSNSNPNSNSSSSSSVNNNNSQKTRMVTSSSLRTVRSGALSTMSLPPVPTPGSGSGSVVSTNTAPTSSVVGQKAPLRARRARYSLPGTVLQSTTSHGNTNTTTNTTTTTNGINVTDSIQKRKRTESFDEDSLASNNRAKIGKFGAGVSDNPTPSNSGGST
ncbi:Kinesin-like protein 5 [Zancudomyces culisetae]|uniref:Kinesin-like protein n=1 Tax=Zancudomyces culisetae TaxID=1213189 RepID=A0A1R1PWD6_ZANCU|nr:Kinesin-like protein 5 [Zancudomyces culisetae]|eukprot:OMH85296.1 Kinesin-like protein 5 [Zancudomyces culisetae]